MRDTLLTASVAALIGIFAASLHGQAPNATTAAAAGAWRGKGLTDVQGIKVGHFTLSERPTGCTAILAQDGTTGGVDVRGGAPGTRETDLLNPREHGQIVNAIVLSGGSAYGLDAAQGVMRWLEEHNIGYQVGAGVVPIVPAAILFDLGFGGDPKIRPTADCGYKAAAAASDGPVAEGNVGAGAGATVGKMGAEPVDEGRARLGRDHAAERTRRRGARRGQRGRRRHRSGDRQGRRRRADRRRQGSPTRASCCAPGRCCGARSRARREHHDRRRRHQREADEGPGAEDRADGARRLRARDLAGSHAGRRRHDLLARHRHVGRRRANLTIIGALAAEAMADAIVRAVTQSETVAGVPSARDLGTVPARFK